MSDSTPISDVKTLAEARAEAEAAKPAEAADYPAASAAARPPSPAEPLPELDSLAPRQRFALEDLMAGRSYTDAAYNAGVDRRTLYRWVNHDPAFRAAMDAWRQRAIGSAEDQLTGATEAAVATLRMAASRDYRAAAVLLKGRGLLSGPGPGRPRKMAADSRELPIPAGRLGDFELRLRELILSFREEGETPVAPSEGIATSETPSESPAT
jgi:hypothetical protein